MFWYYIIIIIILLYYFDIIYYILFINNYKFVSYGKTTLYYILYISRIIFRLSITVYLLMLSGYRYKVVYTRKRVGGRRWYCSSIYIWLYSVLPSTFLKIVITLWCVRLVSLLKHSLRYRSGEAPLVVRAKWDLMRAKQAGHV